MNVTQPFTERFGRRPSLGAAAPGRVNLIGEHTDYNDGFALPIAIERRAVIVADVTANDHSTLWAVDLDETVTVDLTGALSPAAGGFANYLLGVADQFSNDHAIPNLDVALSSTIPPGAGLASSAAVEVAFAHILQQVLDTGRDPLELARLCRRAQHKFPGTPCGIMDMFTATHAKPGHALLIDCRSEEARAIKMPETLAVLIANTNVRHDLADGAYTQRRQTCAAAAAALGIPSLRDVKPGLLSTLDGEQHRCTRHVIGENQRTRLAAAALVTGDLDTLGELMFDSHASLRDLYRVSCPELDTLVDAAAAFRGKSGVIGARMTGAGFGGCAVVLCRTDRVEDVSCGIRGRFAKRFAREADCFTTAAAGPAESLAP